MFQKGDKIVYPMHGAGIIENIEEKEFLGEKQTYYICKLSQRNMQVMIPMGKTNNVGIREIVDSETIEHALKTIKQGEPDLSVNRHQRYQLNMKKMKTGDIFDGTEVIRDLLYLNKNKKLSADDRNLLSTATHILVSELSLVKDIDEAQANELFHSYVNKE